MTIYRSVLHDSVLLENIHTVQNVVAREDRFTTLRDDSLGNRWLILIDEIRQNAQNRKTDHVGENGSLKPTRGYRHRLPLVHGRRIHKELRSLCGWSRLPHRCECFHFVLCSLNGCV